MSLVRRRQAVEGEERERLAPYAVCSGDSRGRVVPEAEPSYRTAFQRDRDRVIHSRAFRRLEYKTQVFVPHEGDHYRDRLTHTLEGAQIARTVCRALRLNEDLGEAVVLAHDLGHTPFGHAGERPLNALLADVGGFDHNRQSLRVVDLLEERHAEFRGLNLTWETREGICKHGADWPHPLPLPDLSGQVLLEAQVADRSDEIAYNNHDLDDGLRSGLIDSAALVDVSLWREVRGDVERRLPDAGPRILHARTIATLIDLVVTDLVEASAARLARSQVASVDEVRAAAGPLVGFSAEMAKRLRELKEFLFDHLYHHPRVLEMTSRAEQVLGDLFRRYRSEPTLLPSHVVARFAEDGEARAIADYIAGMTDRFALAEHERLTEPT